MLFDSHCHLNDEKLYPVAGEVVENAIENGVLRMICIGYGPEANRRALEMADRFPSVYAALGFHPEIAHEVKPEDWGELETMLSHPKAVAVGECGLDYYWDKTHGEVQKAVFRKQLDLAFRIGKPVVVHMREATGDTLEILSERPAGSLSGVMHCYSGSVESMREFLNLGLYISLAGPVTYKNARLPKEAAAAIPGSRILIETDSPYLSPVPYRGKDNVPGHLPAIALEVARLRGMTLEDLSRLVSLNASRLFRVSLPDENTFL